MKSLNGGEESNTSKEKKLADLPRLKRVASAVEYSGRFYANKDEAAEAKIEHLFRDRNKASYSPAHIARFIRDNIADINAIIAEKPE